MIKQYLGSKHRHLTFSSCTVKFLSAGHVLYNTGKESLPKNKKKKRKRQALSGCKKTCVCVWMPRKTCYPRRITRNLSK